MSSPPVGVASQGGPSLLVSNSPEKLTDSLFASQSWANLYVSPTVSPNATGRFRVFLWHVNSLTWNPLLSPKTIHLGVFIQATLGVVSQRKVHEFQGLLNGDISIPSTCLASAQLFQTLDTIPGTIKVAGETLLWSTTLDQLQHPTTLENDPNVRGAVLEFNATGQSIILRTVATLVPGQWGNNTTPPVAEPAPVHPRGYWPYSSLQLDANQSGDPYDVSPFGDSPPIQYCSVCEAGGPEHGANGFLVQGLLDQYGRTNYGCFGADLEYTFYVRNTHSTNAYPCYVGMRARKHGGQVLGCSEGYGSISLA